MTHEPFDDVLELDTQIIDALHGNSICTIKDLCSLSGRELGRLRGIGQQRLKWLIYEMSRKGLAPMSLPRIRWHIVAEEACLPGWGAVSPWYDTADHSCLSLYAIRMECSNLPFAVVKRLAPVAYAVWRPNPLPTEGCTLEEAYEEVRTKLLKKHGVDLRSLTLANLVDLWQIPKQCQH